MQETVGKKPGEIWTDEDLKQFNSVYSRFVAEYEAKGGNKLRITKGDAFLSFIMLYGYDTVDKSTVDEIKKQIVGS